MKKNIGITFILLFVARLIIAAQPTMQFSSLPSNAVYSMPVNFGVYNLAPVPQNLCSPTLTTGTETATCNGLPVCRGYRPQAASFSCSVTTNCGTTVPSNRAGGRCTIALSVRKPGNLASSTQFSFILSYGSYNALLASNSFILNGTNPLPPADSYRTISFKNSCNYPVWFGTITGAAPTHTLLTGSGIDCTGGDPGKQACVNAGGACYARIGGAPDACFSQACTKDDDCVTGASCYALKGKCFWNNPNPFLQPSFQLNTGAINSVEIPEYLSNGLGVVWSGAFGGRTGCTNGGCTSALCTATGENPEGICSLGVGFQQPATQSEPTFITYPSGSPITAPTDAYDVTLINGANVPMAMYPTNLPLPSSGNPYTCGAAGYNQPIPITQPAGDTIGAASWQIASNQSNPSYRYVVPNTSPATRCSTDTDCPSSQYCGLSYSSQSIGSTTAPGSGYLVCGTFAGWFTADQICGTNNNFTNAFDKNGISVKNFQCNTPISLGTMSNLYQCNGNYAVSCYSSNSANCCGCVNWSTQGTLIEVPSNTSYVANCMGVNSTWTGLFNSLNQPQVYDTILFLKQSCPSCYVYPFDDKSSSFTCGNGSTTMDNKVNYTVEFCPGGNGNVGFQPPAH
jgi:hypothetical protein